MCVCRKRCMHVNDNQGSINHKNGFIFLIAKACNTTCDEKKLLSHILTLLKIIFGCHIYKST